MLPLGQLPRWCLWAPHSASLRVLCLLFFWPVEALDLTAFYLGLNARC